MFAAANRRRTFRVRVARARTPRLDSLKVGLTTRYQSSLGLCNRTGEDGLAAMTDLRIQFDERRRTDKLAEIDRRGRAAFLEGAEARSQAAEGRPLTADELERVLKRYPGRQD